MSGRVQRDLANVVGQAFFNGFFASLINIFRESLEELLNLAFRYVVQHGCGGIFGLQAAYFGQRGVSSLLQFVNFAQGPPVQGFPVRTPSPSFWLCVPPVRLFPDVDHVPG
jgi:hypothetical protein